MNKNIFISLIEQTKHKISTLEFKGGYFIPSIIVSIILFSTITLFTLLIPYGCIHQFELFMRNEVFNKKMLMKNKTSNDLPTLIEFLVYWIIWLLFTALCIPVHIINALK